MKKINLKLHFRIFLFSDCGESGADKEILFDKCCICDVEKTLVGKKRPAPLHSDGITHRQIDRICSPFLLHR